MFLSSGPFQIQKQNECENEMDLQLSTAALIDSNNVMYTISNTI